MEYLSLFFILSFGLFLRLMFGTLPADDERVSFWHFRRQRGKRWLYYDAPESLQGGTYTYPVLNHFIVSRLPQKYWGAGGLLLNALYDIVAAGGVYFLTITIAKESGITGTIAGLSPELAATLLFLTSPTLLPARARMKTIKGRSMGMMLITFFFLAGFEAHFSGNLTIWAIALALGLVIIATSLFAQQVMVFFSLVVIFGGIFMPLAAAVASLVIAWFIPRLGLKGPLQFMIDHKIWYLRNYNKGTTATDRNNLKDLLNLPKTLVRDPALFIFTLFFKFTPFILVYSSPALLYLLFTPLQDLLVWQAVLSSPWAHASWLMVLSSLILFGATSLPVLSSFGEAERYLEYATPWFVVLATLIVMRIGGKDAASIFWVLLGWHLTACTANFLLAGRSMWGQSEPPPPEGLKNCVLWCVNDSESPRFVFTPMRDCFRAATFCDAEGIDSSKSYFPFITRKGERGYRHLEEDQGGIRMRRGAPFESIKVFKTHPKELRAKYGATHYILDETYTEGLRHMWSEEQCLFIDNPDFISDGFRAFRIENIN